MPSLADKLENFRTALNGNVEEQELLDILIHIARKFMESDTWQALEIRPVFESLTREQVTRIVATSGGPQIIVKGDPPAQATYAADPIPPNGGNGNGQRHP
jgi:hypothetical protein